MKTKCKLCSKRITNGYKFLCHNCFEFFEWRYGSMEEIEKALQEYDNARRRNNYNNRKTKYKDRWRKQENETD